MHTLRPLAALAALLVLAACSAPRESMTVPPLTDRTWSLVAFGDGTAPIGERVPSATFMTEGTLRGGAGCNGYFGTYELDGDALTTTGFGTTRRMCEPPIMEQERYFLEVLSAAVRWEQDGDRLALFDASGEAVLRFENRDASGTRGERATLSGVVTYRPRIALPPTSVLTVTLADVSRMDAEWVELATHTTPLDGRQVPLAYELRYDPAAIVPSNTYSVSADIHDANGDLLWTNDTMHPVLTSGAPSDRVEIEVVQVDRPADTGGGVMPGPLGAPTVRYTCAEASGSTFSFSTRQRGGALEVDLPEQFGGRTLMVSQVAAASGAKYESDGVMVWLRGSAEAILEIGGETFECSSDG